MRTSKRFGVLAGVVALTVFTAACGDDKKATTTTTVAPAVTTAATTAAAGTTAATTAAAGTTAATTAAAGTTASAGTTAATTAATMAPAGTTAGTTADAGTTAATTAATMAPAGTTAGTTAAATAATTGATTAAGGTAAAGSMKFGLAFDTGGRGDGTFNDSAARGADQAKTELGVEVDELEAKGDEDRQPNLETLTKNGDSPIIAVGFLFTDPLTKVAAANLGTNYGIVDSCVDAPNVACMTFAEEQGSFLVGAAAALKSKSGHIGFIGGQEIDLIKKFEAGYIAGAKAVNPSIKIESKYLGAAGDNAAWSSPDKAKEIADGWYKDGADVIYTAAGGSGAGTIDAAVANNTWAIGVDSDQYLTATPDQQKHILTSMLKKVDNAVFLLYKSAKDGTFKAGANLYDLKSGGVDYATSGGYLDDVKDKLDAFKADIISGKIVVPTKP